jgi:UDP-N-acetylglucosamine 2-epimerase (non-hydrolysing)
MNRTLITRLARFHFAATQHNVDTLLAEGVPRERIARTGNPVVDSLHRALRDNAVAPAFRERLAAITAPRLVVLTTHRRESFGDVMTGNLKVLRRFVEEHDDVALVFPVHPNPNVGEPTRAVLGDVERVHLLEPLAYDEFVHLLARAWLVVSDSGGIQEEAPSLGKALLVLRENTERPEAIAAGVARLVGGAPERLAAMLRELHADDAWIRGVREIANPFGAGDAGPRIAAAIESLLDARLSA